MNAEYLMFRGRRWLLALVVAACLAVPVVSFPMFSSDESDTKSNAWINTPALADGSQPAFGGGG